MTSERYFSELAAQLGRLPIQEREEALRFHQEYAQEAGFTTYQELGPPRPWPPSCTPSPP